MLEEPGFEWPMHSDETSGTLMREGHNWEKPEPNPTAQDLTTEQLLDLERASHNPPEFQPGPNYSPRPPLTPGERKRFFAPIIKASRIRKAIKRGK
jgi:hypothetical protein